MAERWWDEHLWIEPSNHACRLMWAHGCCLVTWPSGRKTLEEVAGTVVETDRERKNDREGQMLAREMENLHNTMQMFREESVKGDYFIRMKHRRKARRIVSAEWMKPSEYRGPGFDHHSVLLSEGAQG